MQKNNSVASGQPLPSTGNVDKANRFMISLGLFFVFITIFVFLKFFYSSDNYFTSYIVNGSFFALYLLSRDFIIRKERRKKILIIGLIILTFLISYITYYLAFSIRIEPLIYLNVKYGYSYSDMKVNEVTRRNRNLICILYCDFSPRSAEILYKGDLIYVYSHNNLGWKDNLEAINKYKIHNKKNIDEFEKILSKHNNSYKIADDKLTSQRQSKAWVEYLKNKVSTPSLGGYTYYIFINSSDENEVGQIISNLNNYISTDTEYFLYIIKDKNMYEKIENRPNLEYFIYDSIKKLQKDNNGGSYDRQDLISHITSLSATQISYYYDTYSPSIFKNPEIIGLETERYIGYRDPTEFKSVIFMYRSKRYKPEAPLSIDFWVVGLK